MSEAIETARLILTAEQQGFPETTKKVDDLENSLDALTASYRSGAIDLDTYIKKGGSIQSQLDATKDALKTAEDAVKKYGSAQAAAAALTEKSRSKLAGFGQAALQSGRIVQDFAQGGIGGILNNIEGFVQAVGGGAGLAGVLTIVGVGFALLKPQIVDFVKSLGIGEGGVKEFASQLDTLNARIKEIEEKPHKLTVDVQELETAKEIVDSIRSALSEVEKLRKSQSHYEKESGATIESKIAEAPGGAQAVEQKLHDQIVVEQSQRITAPLKAREEELQKQIEEAEHTYKILSDSGNNGSASGYRATADRLRKEQEDTERNRLAAAHDIRKQGGSADVEVGDVLRQAEKGAGVQQEQAQRRLEGLLKQTGQEGLAKEVVGASPRQLKLNDQADEAMEELAEATAEAGKQQREDAKKKKKADDDYLADLERRGKDGEAEALADNRRIKQEAEEEIRVIVAAYKSKLAPGLEAQGIKAIGEGRAPEDVQADLRGKASEAIQAGGVDRSVARGAADRIATDLIRDLRARIAVKVADLPAPRAPAPAARKKPGAAAQRIAAARAAKAKPPIKPKPTPRPQPRLKPGKTAVPASTPLPPVQRAAQALTRDNAAKAKQQADAAQGRANKIQTAEYKEGLARQVFQQSRQRTGVQFTPDQARSVADESVKLQGQGLNANEATLAAMNQGLNAIRAMYDRIAKQQAMANQLGRGFNQVANQAQPNQFAAQNWGGGN